MNKSFNQAKVGAMLVSLIAAFWFLLQADLENEGIASQYSLLFVGFVVLSIALNMFLTALQVSLEEDETNDTP